MTEIKIKTFEESDLPSAAKLCRQSMVYDIMPDFLLQEKTFEDANFDPELTLTAFNNSGSAIGFIQGVTRQRDNERVGYIKLFCVDSNERRKGIGRQLYMLVEDKLKKSDIRKIRIYESWPNYFMPGVDPFYTEAVCFFERMGYRKIGDTSNLEADLAGQTFDTQKEEASLTSEGFVIRRANEDDKNPMLQWLRLNFPAWEIEVTRAFRNSPISVHLAEKGNNIIAFSAYEGNNTGTGWFGPMGTTEAARGKGIGGILYRKCLKDMKDIGFTRAIIPWVGPIPFYMHNSNARVKRVFWRYEKNLA